MLTSNKSSLSLTKVKSLQIMANSWSIWAYVQIQQHPYLHDRTVKIDTKNAIA